MFSHHWIVFCRINAENCLLPLDILLVVTVLTHTNVVY